MAIVTGTLCVLSGPSHALLCGRKERLYLYLYLICREVDLSEFKTCTLHDLVELPGSSTTTTVACLSRTLQLLGCCKPRDMYME